MTNYVLIGISLVFYVSAENSVNISPSIILEPQAQATQVNYGTSSYNDYFQNGGKKYVSASELTSLAHNSALKAKNAVLNQETAANHAAFTAKSGLAQTASLSAATSQAALVGKQVVVQSLKHQLQEAERILQVELTQYEHLKQISAVSMATAKEAEKQLNTISAILSGSQERVNKVAKAAAEAKSAGAAQQAMIQETKKKVEELTAALHKALNEVQETAVLAAKAAIAAKSAEHLVESAASNDAVVAAATENKSEEDKGNNDISFGYGFH